MSKKELAYKYGISATTLRALLNERYFTELALFGYEKKQRLLPPCVVRKFIDLYGEPLNNDI